MSIRVQHLSKVYNAQRALNDISFEIGSGEIVGFLGPNGAGKSTTFKITTGYLPATDGFVEVAGHRVADNSKTVKKIIGYLPEHNPLYLDMYVHEYLHFIGSLYDLKGTYLKSRVSEMVERCGLIREQNKKIENLSKGYRQRVGLAQALIHNPSVLILDEPTSGLDPNQLIEIRKLIKEVANNKTVIFSTHIMQEVEALCDRAIIINKGEIIADDSMKNLLQAKSGQTFIVEFENKVAAEIFSSIDGIDTCVQLNETTIKISGSDLTDTRAQIFRLAADKQLSLVGLKQEQQSLENIFQELTKQATDS